MRFLYSGHQPCADLSTLLTMRNQRTARYITDAVFGKLIDYLAKAHVAAHFTEVSGEFKRGPAPISLG